MGGSKSGGPGNWLTASAADEDHPSPTPSREGRGLPTPRPPVGGSEESKQKGISSSQEHRVRVAPPSEAEEHIMAFVRVEQRNAHLAGAVRLDYVNGRDGKVAKGTVTAISNTPAERRGREEEATAIQWTLWGTRRRTRPST